MKVLIAGDFCPRNRVAKAFENGDYSAVLDEVRELTSQVDYAIVNFECPVADDNTKPIDKIGPNLRCTERGVEAIKYGGFDSVTLANNHFLDFGDKGVVETIKVLDSHRVDHVGGGLNLEEASRILYKDHFGKRLAVVNCCEHEFSIATEKTGGSNPLDPVKQYYAIKTARRNADWVLVVVHGGHEHFQLPSPRMVDTYRFFIDAGADAIVNHHQHCFSGYEMYKGKPIFYGLGNFCFDEPQKKQSTWYEGYAVTIDFSSEAPSFSLHPYKQCSTEPRVELLPNNEFDAKIGELNAVIADPHLLQKAIDSYYASCAKMPEDLFEPIGNRYYLGAKHKGLLPSLISKQKKLKAKNIILCEAHRDKLFWWLKH